MSAVRRLVVAFALVAAFGCDGSPTAPQIPAPGSALVASCASQAPSTELPSCPAPPDGSTLRVGGTARPVMSAAAREQPDGSPAPARNRNSNYAVAW
jgi:hypothetical protein